MTGAAVGMQPPARYDGVMPLNQRMVDLEVRVAYQDKLIAQLDDVIREFVTRVEALEWQLGELRNRVGSAPIGPANDPPPHY